LGLLDDKEIAGQPFRWRHDIHPGSSVGTNSEHRGQRVKNGLVIL